MDNDYHKNSVFKVKVPLQFRAKDSLATDIVTHCLTADCKSCLGSYHNEILGHCFICRCKCHPHADNDDTGRSDELE